ncbi:hypothetical protein KIN20_037498 [Parelaphostrongylus tenuis]|uniref:Uncharacterized protein n=1 Tax=Parelaphostrongylus tenuis TaxID=148309 RepID=A0AAD5WMI3_PARTN|nr:hypothetical protein KIN20_037498 [Parelaphostrongylus tenuis]
MKRTWKKREVLECYKSDNNLQNDSVMIQVEKRGDFRCRMIVSYNPWKFLTWNNVSNRYPTKHRLESHKVESRAHVMKIIGAGYLKNHCQKGLPL